MLRLPPRLCSLSYVGRGWTGFKPSSALSRAPPPSHLSAPFSYVRGTGVGELHPGNDAVDAVTVAAVAEKASNRLGRSVGSKIRKLSRSRVRQAKKAKMLLEASVLRLFGCAKTRREAACSRTWARWARLGKTLLNIGGGSVGNKVQILSCGNIAFEKMWEAIDKAKHTVHMETYILKLDNIGRKTIDRLHEALRRGVKVSLMYDSAGSTAVPLFVDPILSSLREAGARIIEFNPLLMPPWRRRAHHILDRNHRKILLVDDSIAFCGGMNIADEYCGPELGGTGTFHDTHVRVEGPAAQHFATVVRDSIREASYGRKVKELGSSVYPGKGQQVPLQIKLDGLAAGTHESVSAEGVCVQVLSSNSRRNIRQLQKSIRLCIQYSNNRCYITSPYFLPPYRLLRAMTKASRRGVDVRIITSGAMSDVQAMKFASRYIYSKLLNSGVRIYEYQAATLHTKSVSVDSVYSFLGSFNFDGWSYHRNLEVGVGMLDTEVSRKVEEQFNENILRSKEITKDEIRNFSVPERVMQFLCYIGYRVAAQL
mmetsp:Transcript_27990/g.68031  ORF Transcript_27990/g.68031 Transcript_27990/m.68031 type:complete len:539 (-) Transcript_27990:163-1779(-)